MKNTQKLIGTMRAFVCAAFIFGLLASFAFRQSNMVRVSAQRAETNEIAASPESNVQTFVNTNPITINDNTTASPYPSQMTVSGVNPALVTNVRVVLFGFTHTFPDDVDIILVGPQGQRAVLMSDAGGGDDVSNLQFAFEQTATATTLPDSAVLTGSGTTYRPANFETTDTFPAPGPGALNLAPADLSVFSGTNPNGVWSLYVVDDAGTDVGSISAGWDLVLTVPTVFTVTKTADTNGVCNSGVDCSLREALAAAQNGDLINFSSLFDTPQTINLLTALPDITRSITIQGKGANLLTVRRDFNAPSFGIFSIQTGGLNIAISGMTITNGRDVGGMSGDGVGGGIDSVSNLTLTGVHVTGNEATVGGGVGLAFADGIFTNCTFSGNTVSHTGGGIFYQGSTGRTLRIINSTVSANRSILGGGGILNQGDSNNSSRVEVVGSTIANNTANNGGGINTFTQGGANSTATTTLRNSIIAGNSPNNLATAAGGGAAAITSNGSNLTNDPTNVFLNQPTDKFNTNAGLAPLSLIGGQTPTHALLGGSPALNAGDASGQTTDQRGQPRVFGASADIGAVEMRSIIVTNAGDAGAGSLRQAIIAANANGTGLDDIIFDNTVFNTVQTIHLLSVLPDITSGLTINGAGANLLTVRRPASVADFRIFNIQSGITGGVAISGMTITGGNVGSGNFGGGIRSQSNLTLTNVHVTGNTADNGGGVSLEFANGVFTGCTFSGNTAISSGGGIYYVDNDGHTLRLVNSTVSGNNSADAGILNYSIGANSRLEVVNSTIANNNAGTSGIRTFANGAGTTAATTLRNSIIAGNSPNNLQTETAGGGVATFETLGFNLANDNGGGFLNIAPVSTDKTNANAGLGALADNGGTVPTRALLLGSAALDAGSNSGSGTLTDQRGFGFNRTIDLPAANAPNGDGTDIGAFEAQTAPTDAAPTAAATAANVAGAGGTSYNFTVTYTDDTAINVSTINTSDVSVTGPNGFTATPAFVSVDNNTNGTPRIATYSFTAPGGSWDIGDNGTYNIVMNANQVFDNTGNPVAPGNIGSFTVNILPTISIGDLSANETNAGGVNFNFNVTLSNASSQTVTVSYQTANGTATAPSDYAAVPPTTLTFNPGETFKQVQVLVISDTTFEPDETFFVNLSNPTNATIADGQGLGTILNDDAIIVTTAADAGAGSLRQAITDANANGAGADIINFSALFNTPQIINLETALPDITGSLTINGTGANLLTVRRALNAATDFRIFNIPGGVSGGVTISEMTVTGGRAIGGFGGGIRSLSNLTLTNVHVTGNHAGFSGGGVSMAFADGVFTGCTFSSNTAAFSGGGINYQGNSGRTLRLVSSTVSGNNATNSGGGITNLSSSDNSRLEVTNSTIANNTGGGILTFTQGGAGNTATTTLRNSIIANNTPNNLATGTSGGGAATFQTLGFNLASDNGGGFLNVAPITNDIINANARLAPLSLIGGQTPTHALLGGSPALNAGDASGQTTDQRGQPRVFGASADIGAVEVRSIIVTNAGDAGAGSLRQAITDANANGATLDDIIFDNTVFNTAQIINLATALPDITSSLTINGAGANLLTVRRAAGAATNFSVFNLIGGNLNSVAISGMTITGGNANGGNTFGGGIFSQSNLTLTNVHVTGNTANFGGGVHLGFADGVFTNCTFSGNTAGNGGGIYFVGDGGRRLRLVSSTVSGNQASGGSGGGGIVNLSISGNSRLEVVSSTIANNTAMSGGGILTFTQGGAGSTAVTTLRNSIIAGNSPNNLLTGTFNGGAVTFQTLGFNLASDNGSGFLNGTGDKVNTNPLLSPLYYFGGTTPTHGLYDGSPAIDAGQSSGTTADQRGNRRPFDFPGITNPAGGDGADIGAFEGQTIPTAASVSIGGQIFTPEARGLRNAVVTLTDQSGNVRSVTTAAFGYYRFDEVAAGETYIVSVQSKRYRFAAQVVNVTEAVDDLNFTAER